jgi:hypothetical protein
MNIAHQTCLSHVQGITSTYIDSKMPKRLTRPELVERVERIMTGGWRDEEEMKTLFREIGENVPCPRSQIQEFIFHAKDDPDAGIIVERMLAYQPIRL